MKCLSSILTVNQFYLQNFLDNIYAFCSEEREREKGKEEIDAS